LIGLLQAGKGHNVDSLSTECGVSRRTIFRDLDVLRQAGVPLQLDEEFQVYHLASSYSIPPGSFSASEALAVLVLCHELGGIRQLPFLAPARTAAAKLEATLPDGVRKQVRSVADAIRIHFPPSNPLDGQSPIYEQLLDAISTRRSVRIHYDSLHERELIRTRLSPYRMLFSRHTWYVIARSSIHRAVRTFNVGRIRQLEFADARYNIPRNFSLERYLGNAWHLVPGRGPNYDVLVRFQKHVAQNVAEVVWHKTQSLKWNDDGSLDYSVNVKGLSEISWWILGYGDQAQVIKPDELRQLVAGHATRMLESYNGAS
jgi:predicted DNA-binding transcriptional regulator YafY